MADLDFRQITPEGQAPQHRIADAFSLNNIIKRIVQRDLSSALMRQDVQQSIDGKPPFEQTFMRETGQEGRCNLNFNDMKREMKREQSSYYDLTESVPTIGIINSHFGTDIIKRFTWNQIMSEEFHKMLKDWPSFDTYYQLQIQKMCSHGLAFLYFEDEVNWQWRVAGLEDFKVPRGTTLAEEEIDIAVAFRDIPISQLYKWVSEVADDDKRWNKKEVYTAILKATDRNIVFSIGEWEKWQQILKNNDIYAATTAQDIVKLAHAWVREYDGSISQYLTLRNGENQDFLFKCERRFESVHQCFTFFPYEVGTNGTLHSVRGKAHEIYPQIQVLNTLRCRWVDNVQLAGSLLLQPKTAADAEDMALMFFGGVTVIPPEVNVQQNSLNDPSKSMVPLIQDMTFSLNDDGKPNVNSGQPTPNGLEKTRAQVIKESAQESQLPTASLNLFYQPWRRHLNEVWRRVKNKELKASDPGGQMVFAFRKRCKLRGVPDEAMFDPESWIEPYRAIGYGSPANRQLTLERFMQYYGSLDPVGQNNLLRDMFAQGTSYSMVDRYVPAMDANGRQPVDSEIAELQNAAMSAGKPCQVRPNDAHIIHMQTHLPDLESDLDALESGQGDPNLLQVAQLKTQHCASHMQILKPDALTKGVVSEITRRFNNDYERTMAAVDHAARQQQKEQERQAAEQQKAQEEAGQRQQELELNAREHQQSMEHAQQAHEQKMLHRQQEADQKQKLDQAKTVSAIHQGERATDAKVETQRAESEAGIAQDKKESAAEIELKKAEAAAAAKAKPKSSEK